MNSSTDLSRVHPKRIRAKADGYSFSLEDDVWRLDKNVSINVRRTVERLAPPAQDGFLRTLAYYAAETASGTTAITLANFRRMLVVTGATKISDTVLINYRATLTRRNEWQLSIIRIFLRRWYDLGYPGVGKDVVDLAYSWRLKGARKGDVVKRKDPLFGPLTDIELQAFNEAVVSAYERDELSASELVMCRVISNTGRRPIQISQLRTGDVVANKAPEWPPYVLNIPRAKQRGSTFRKSFKPFALSEDLWELLDAQKERAITEFEKHVGFELQDEDRKQLPLFPDFEMAKLVTSPKVYRDLAKTDKLHITSDEVTDILQRVTAALDIYSERTGDPLHVTTFRFRYTTGTRAAREGFGTLVIAELLDHSDTQNAGIYIKNVPEHVKRLDEAVGYQLAQYAQAFAGILVDSERDAERGDEPTSRVRSEEGKAIGTCGEYGFCGANVPIPCYTCTHFQPWLNGPHEEVYQQLLDERERIIKVTNDIQIAATLDRSILAVAEVITRCERRRQELESETDLADG